THNSPLIHYTTLFRSKFSQTTSPHQPAGLVDALMLNKHCPVYYISFLYLLLILLKNPYPLNYPLALVYLLVFQRLINDCLHTIFLYLPASRLQFFSWIFFYDLCRCSFFTTTIILSTSILTIIFIFTMCFKVKHHHTKKK